ncbi:MAG: dihydrolipoamide acetyltransferase family protein [Phycisphaerales bacterium]
MAGPSSTDPNVFILPDLGEGVHEAELISWKVKPGDRVEEHQTIAEMETDKALVEVPSPRAGVIKELFGNVGDILKVGSPAWTYEDEGSAGAGAKQARAAGSAEAKSSGGGKTHAPGTNGTHGGGRSGAAKQGVEEEREDAGTVVGTMGGSLGAVSKQEGKALATPAVRRLARDLGVDIDAVRGSGIGGRVTDKDVRSAASSGTAPKGGRGVASGRGAAAPVGAAPDRADRAGGDVDYSAILAAASGGGGGRSTGAAPAGSPTVVPFRGVRRTIAGRLRSSVDTAVHFTVMDEVDVTALDTMRRRLAAASGEKVSFLPFVGAAVCRVLRDARFASLNATTDDANEQIIQHKAVHLGIAADTDAGLMVPVIRDADALGVLQISREIVRVAKGARERSIGRDELIGSTFTISNVGSHAGRFATPVINYPEAGILAVGRAREGMVVKNGWFRVGQLLPLSLACDHRVVDGATAALALAEIVRLLGEPDSLLTPARG